MVNKKKVACVILSIGDEYRQMGECARRSFEKFHPDVDMHLIDETNINSFEVSKHIPLEVRNHFAIFRFAIAAEIMGKNKYDKVIVLGADTITCDRIERFMNDDKSDLIATLCYPYQLQLPYGVKEPWDGKSMPYPYTAVYTPLLCSFRHADGGIEADENGDPAFYYHCGDVNKFLERAAEYEAEQGVSPLLIDYLHANSDVVCFNSLKALKDVFRLSIKHWSDFEREYEGCSEPIAEMLAKIGYDFYGDQGGLNLVIALSILGATGQPPEHPTIQRLYHTISFADAPQVSAPALYNARSKRSVEELIRAREDDAVSPHPKSSALGDHNLGASVSDFHSVDGKLFTVDNKQIKVWHYLSAFGNHTKAQGLRKSPSQSELDEGKKIFCEKVNTFIFDIFNQETRDFFTEHCDCGEFFQKEFALE